jgi:HlyD family secretion protein
MSDRKSTGWWKWLVFLLIAAGAGYGGWRWYAKRATEAAPDYRTVAVGPGDITQTVTANGQISPVKSVTVGSQVSGIIVDIQVDFNSKVTNGQVIARIDPSTYQQNINQAEAEVANAAAALELTELNYRRASVLRTNELISPADYDKTVVDLHQAQAVLRTRESALKKSQVDLDRTTIYSPIDGVIISRAVDVGQTVAASFSTPTLFSIANDLRNMRIEAAVSEADVGGVLEGQNVTFTVDAYPGRQFQGRVTQVRFAPVTNQNVVNYTTIVTVNNDDLKLRPGMTANASIITAERQNVLRVPNAALRFRPPEKLGAKGATNGVAAAGTNRGSGRASSGGALAADSPSAAGGDSSREERRRRFESMTPEQRAAFRARMAEGGGGGGFPGGGGRRSGGTDSNTRTAYLLEKDTNSNPPKVVLKPVTLKLGITDGSFTEVLEGLKEGDILITGLNTPETSATTVRPGGSSPFGGPFGGMRPPR